MVTELNISEEIISYIYDYFPTKRILYYYKANPPSPTHYGASSLSSASGWCLKPHSENLPIRAAKTRPSTNSITSISRKTHIKIVIVSSGVCHNRDPCAESCLHTIFRVGTELGTYSRSENARFMRKDMRRSHVSLHLFSYLCFLSYSVFHWQYGEPICHVIFMGTATSLHKTLATSAGPSHWI